LLLASIRTPRNNTRAVARRPSVKLMTHAFREELDAATALETILGDEMTPNKLTASDLSNMDL
jgi:hypothetical protein